MYQAENPPAAQDSNAANGAALRIVVVYAVFACLWILLSDKAVGFLFDDPAKITLVSMIKGWLFVAVTSLLLFGLIRRLLVEILTTSQLSLAAQKERIRASQLLDDIANSSPDAIFAKDLEGRYLLFNKETARIFGKTADQALGRDDTALFPAQAAMIRANDRRVIAENHINTYEETLTTVDGPRTYLAIKGPLRDGGGNVIGVFGISRDITERAQAVMAMRESEKRYRLLASSTFEGIAMVEDGRITDANEQLLNMLGFSRGELIGMRLADLIPTEDRERVMENLRGVNDGCIEHKMARKDYSQIPVETQGQSYDHEGRAVRITVVRDLTQHKHAETIAERYYRVVQASLDGFWITDTTGRIVDVNDSICRILGYSRQELLGMCIGDIEADESPREVAAHTREIMQAGHVQFEARHRRKDGNIINVEVSVLFVAGFDELLFAFVKDVTDRKLAEEALRESELFLRESQSIAGLGTYVLDVASGVWRSSGIFDKLFGIGKGHERSIDSWAALVHSDDRAMMVDYFTSEVVGLGRLFDKEYRIVRQDDRAERWVHGLGKLEFDDQGRPVRMRGTILDVTERKLAEERIRTLAYFDALTNLPNRRLLMDRLTQALIASKRTQEFGALMILDLDNFKVLNDTQGHDVGDLLLVEVAKRIVASVRQEDTVSRLGGDEYVMMIERLGPQETFAASQAETIAEKVRKTLNQPYTLSPNGPLHHSTPSIGVTLFRSQDQSMDVLLKQADMALYQAKGAGRNAIRFYNPAMQAAVEARSTMEVALRKGLEQGEFRLFYQPQLDHDRNLTGTEALLRWFPADRPPVSPAQFIPLAEDTGLIIPIGQWVMETACAQLKDWSMKSRTRDLQISVNVSARQFRQANFVEQVFDALRSSGANPARLKLELTESVVLENIDEVIVRMQQIKALGVKFSLDDFGTGFSSLSYLKRLPLDQIKIDRSFVRDIDNDPNDAAIVRAIIALGNSLGIEVIAEGVETEVQRNFLSESGCRNYQGYLYGKAMSIDEWDLIL